MNYTENYQLPQWEETDRVLMADFNAMTAKLEAGLSELLAGLPKLATGTYAGTGEYGASHPNTLTFDFKPYVLLCYNRSSYSTPALFIRGEERYLADYGNSYAEMLLTWGENSVSWYNTEDEHRQLNYESATYRYLAFGW